MNQAFLFGGRDKDSALYVVTSSEWMYRDGFALWLSQNFPIWERFEREASKVWDSGRRHYSARTIGEFIRHETALVSANDGDFKVNNNRFPDLARLYLAMHSERGDFFDLRDCEARRAA